MIDDIINALMTFKHYEFNEAAQLLNKSKLKTGRERYILIEKAKHKIYPFSGSPDILLLINKIDKIL